MSYYLTQASYSSEAWMAQIKNPENRFEKLRPMLDRHGVKIIQSFFAFGEYDLVIIFSAPDEKTIASVLMSVAGSGAVSKMKTTALMAIEDGVDALKAAGSVDYSPPKAN